MLGRLLYKVEWHKSNIKVQIVSYHGQITLLIHPIPVITWSATEISDGGLICLTRFIP